MLVAGPPASAALLMLHLEGVKLSSPFPAQVVPEQALARVGGHQVAGWAAPLQDSHCLQYFLPVEVLHFGAHVARAQS